MKANQVLIGSVIMTFFILHNAIGQAPATGADSAKDRQAASELIEATLKKAAQAKNPAEQLAQYQKTTDQVLKLCPTNLFATRTLKQALAKVADATDHRQAARLLQDGLREASETLAFKPFIEAPVPEGFPKPTPVGEIQIKKYPAHRLARTKMAGGESSAFFTLFNHIKKKDIAMTAPVEMTYSDDGKNSKLQRQSMGFLYRNTRLGKPEKDGKVQVIDVPATMALSLGLRGTVTSERLAEARAHLDAWLKKHADEYKAIGPLRTMGYNSPFVAADRRFTEVEIPIPRSSSPR